LASRRAGTENPRHEKELNGWDGKGYSIRRHNLLEVLTKRNPQDGGKKAEAIGIRPLGGAYERWGTRPNCSITKRGGGSRKTRRARRKMENVSETNAVKARKKRYPHQREIKKQSQNGSASPYGTKKAPIAERLRDFKRRGGSRPAEGRSQGEFRKKL